MILILLLFTIYILIIYRLKYHHNAHMCHTYSFCLFIITSKVKCFCLDKKLDRISKQTLIIEIRVLRMSVAGRKSLSNTDNLCVRVYEKQFISSNLFIFINLNPFLKFHHQISFYYRKCFKMR